MVVGWPAPRVAHWWPPLSRNSASMHPSSQILRNPSRASTSFLFEGLNPKPGPLTRIQRPPLFHATAGTSASRISQRSPRSLSKGSASLLPPCLDPPSSAIGSHEGASSSPASALPIITAFISPPREFLLPPASSTERSSLFHPLLFAATFPICGKIREWSPSLRPAASALS